MTTVSGNLVSDPEIAGILAQALPVATVEYVQGKPVVRVLYHPAVESIDGVDFEATPPVVRVMGSGGTLTRIVATPFKS